MQLNHINLTVPDALETAQFLENYFGLRKGHDGEQQRTFAMLTDGHGMILTLMRGKKGVEIVYPDTFHIGFAQSSEEAVNEINDRLKADGYDVPAPARMHGSWTFYFRLPGAFMIEVLA